MILSNQSSPPPVQLSHENKNDHEAGNLCLQTIILNSIRWLIWHQQENCPISFIVFSDWRYNRDTNQRSRNYIYLSDWFFYYVCLLVSFLRAFLLLAVLSVLRHHQMHCCLKTEGNTKKQWLISYLFKRNNLPTQRKIVKFWQF